MDKHLIPYNLSEKFIKSHNNNINDYVMKIITILMILIIIIVIIIINQILILKDKVV